MGGVTPCSLLCAKTSSEPDEQNYEHYASEQEHRDFISVQAVCKLCH